MIFYQRCRVHSACTQPPLGGGSYRTPQKSHHQPPLLKLLLNIFFWKRYPKYDEYYSTGSFQRCGYRTCVTVVILHTHHLQRWRIITQPTAIVSTMATQNPQHTNATAQSNPAISTKSAEIAAAKAALQQTQVPKIIWYSSTEQGNWFQLFAMLWNQKWWNSNYMFRGI